MKRLFLVVCFFLTVLPGCAPRIVAQNEKSITIEHIPEYREKAFKMADDYCHSLGKSAVPTALVVNNAQIVSSMESFECK